jgi:peptidoglycan/LPS O-acetylase OafA/YrhL
LVLAVLAGCAVFVRYAVWYDHFPSWTTTSLLAQFDYFAIGMALAVASIAVARAGKPPRFVSIIDRLPGLFVLLALLTFLVMADFAPRQDPNVPILHLVMSPITFAHEEAGHWLAALLSLLLMLPVIFGDPRRGITRRLLGQRPLLWIGLVSYGVYLWHAPLLGWVAAKVGTNPSIWIVGSPIPTLFLLTLAISLPLAALSYRFVELPFLRRRYPSPSTMASPAPTPSAASSTGR